jgi:UDP-2,3-diacylglucosamine pyrophosphatase LpxH
MLELQENALLVFVSDTHIGGDPGCDGFESPDELQALFEELVEHEGLVELVLAGDLFDFLQIGKAPAGENRASLTIGRPEYCEMFAALARFREGEGKRVTYLPGNHDAEMWWNPGIQETLRERGLVDEFACAYAARFRAGKKRRVVYCEHGNQFDPPNHVTDYSDGLDTPLGHHVVTDFTRRIAPFGEVKPGLDLSEIKMVYPVMAVPQWIASRYFYDFAAKVLTHLFLPVAVAYFLYRLVAHFVDATSGEPGRLAQVLRALPDAHALFTEIAGFGLVLLAIFGVFFLVIRRSIRRALKTVSPQPQHEAAYSPAEKSRSKVREVLKGESPPLMDSSIDPAEVDVFVSGHTHLPSLEEVLRADGKDGKAVMVNSGCWLRQLQPVSPYLKGPPVFVSRFVLTHVRVFVRDEALHVELWEHPKPAGQRLTWIERLLSLSRRSKQPAKGAGPRLRASSTV